MRAARLSFALGLLLAAPTAAYRAPLLYDCGRGKLDLACSRSVAPKLRIEGVEARHADKAYVVRFGGPGQEGEPSWVVQLGSAVRQALFWAAVITTFLL